MVDPASVEIYVVTGGPCGGKSTAQAMIMEELPNYGISPMWAREAATDIFSSGLKPTMLSPEQWGPFQSYLMREQMDKEESRRRFATLLPGSRPVVFADRGVPDNMAYMGESAFLAAIGSMGLTLSDVRERRYAAAYHLVTAAEGAEAFYTTENNEMRTESAEEARALDTRTMNAWAGHRHLTVLANTRIEEGKIVPRNFAQKMAALKAAVCQDIGIPVPTSRERKFLLERAPLNFPVDVRASSLDQVYLPATPGLPTSERRLRVTVPRTESATGGGRTSVYAEKKWEADGTASVRERVLSTEEAEALLREAGEGAPRVRKERLAFVWEGQYFRLDMFAHPAGKMILEVETTNEQPEVLLPDWLHVVREVTGEHAYRNASMARLVRKPQAAEAIRR